MPSSRTKISLSSGSVFSASSSDAKNTSAALRDKVPSLLMTNGTGEASDKRLVAALAEILLAEFPFEGFGQRHEILDDFAIGLRLGEDCFGRRWVRLFVGGFGFRWER